MDLILAAVGLVILLVAGDLLVRGAVAVSLRLGVPALIVSLTIVAFGTSAPELLIAIDSALIGAPGLALGNVIGSNIANILLVLGLPALISNLHTRDSDSTQSYVFMVGVSLIFIALCFAGPLYLWHGAVLLALLILMMAHTIRDARAARRDRPENGGDLDDLGVATMPMWRALAYLAVGIVGLPVGADMLVEGARSVAQQAGISDEVIGLTLVAVGTSLPELATTVMAAIRRQADVALGNVVGSNILNILAIMGVTSFFGPLQVSDAFLGFDLWVMLAAALVLGPFILWKIRLGRRVGTAFILGYAAYVAFLF